jgi:hypothetical protein
MVSGIGYRETIWREPGLPEGPPADAVEPALPVFVMPEPFVTANPIPDTRYL